MRSCPEGSRFALLKDMGFASSSLTFAALPRRVSTALSTANPLTAACNGCHGDSDGTNAGSKSTSSESR